MADASRPNPQGTAAGSLRALLTDFRPDLRLDAPVAAQQAVHLAGILRSRAVELQTPHEQTQQRELERIMRSPHDKATLMQMTDQGLRSGRAARAVEQLTHILDVQGVPRFFSPFDQALLQGFRAFGGYLPGVAVPLVQGKMRAETANVILPAEEEHLLPHLRRRRDAGLRMNLNLLGEALLGEDAVQGRLAIYLEALQRPEIECLSVKISTLYSQISPLAWEETLEVLWDRLELLYREAARMRFVRPDDSTVAKFVYLDMEEYRDMRLTAEAFMGALDRPGLERVGAGIALQAYLPDAWCVQRQINAWARKRVAAGGSPVTIRLVKGANLEMERVDAALHGWPQAPFRSKAEVDANYKRMLHEGLRPENIAAVRLGVASHNLFELTYALVTALEQGVLDRVQLEMLEGMANHQRRALSEVANDLLLYAPATRREHFVHAIGYLVRRLDENTGPDNFLGHAFRLEVGTPEWRRLASQFLASFGRIEGLRSAPRRTQDRHQPPQPPDREELRLQGFSNEPDTDFSLPRNLSWARGIIEDWQGRCADRAADIPLVVAGAEVREDRKLRRCLDPSRPGSVVGRYREATAVDLERAVACARTDPRGWRSLAPKRRDAILGAVAQELRRGRADLMGAAMADAGKILPESDTEVSEAVDFVEFYRRSALEFQGMANLRASPKGVVAVISPWNFPIAIPCGGVAAALAAGNCVILKPASNTVLVAYELCKRFWQAGVPREALQFLPCSGNGVGAMLATHPEVDAVILTGGTATALRMLEARPQMHLMAETGGKDATIVTALADRDQAIRNVLHSAFSHSGQKCSATSLLILEQEVYQDADFKAALCDAVRSLPVGPAWQRKSRIGPLIRPPAGALERGLKELEPGESWAVMPRQLGHNPQLWTPGVKWDVRPGNFTHMTELFGPLLAVMEARDLDHAIELVNQTGYGLTSGIESLDEREQQRWRERIRAGNLYINRVTTGAVVLRQPFGGMGKSAFGPGLKAGGPNYLAQLMDFEELRALAAAGAVADPLLAELCAGLIAARDRLPKTTAAEVDRVLAAIASYDRNLRDEFGREHDHFRLLGQDNIRRYRPVEALRVRLHRADSFFELFARVAAARSLGCRITVSSPPGLSLPGLALLRTLTRSWGDDLSIVEESDRLLAEGLVSGRSDRLRYAAPARVTPTLFDAARRSGRYVACAPVLMEGRIELLWYLREQSISNDYHRYGNLGEKGAQERAEVP